jgi:hypothetical protein
MLKLVIEQKWQKYRAIMRIKNALNGKNIGQK